MKINSVQKYLPTFQGKFTNDAVTREFLAQKAKENPRDTYVTMCYVEEKMPEDYEISFENSKQNRDLWYIKEKHFDKHSHINESYSVSNCLRSLIYDNDCYPKEMFYDIYDFHASSGENRFGRLFYEAGVGEMYKNSKELEEKWSNTLSQTYKLINPSDEPDFMIGMEKLLNDMRCIVNKKLKMSIRNYLTSTIENGTSRFFTDI